MKERHIRTVDSVIVFNQTLSRENLERNMATTHTWHGVSGKGYQYTVYNINTSWNDVPGNYIYAGQTSTGWKAAYIGQTKSFKDRLPDHNEEACAKRNGATHIHAHVNNGGEAARKAEEADLIKKHQPPCNQQGR